MKYQKCVRVRRQDPIKEARSRVQTILALISIRPFTTLTYYTTLFIILTYKQENSFHLYIELESRQNSQTIGPFHNTKN